MVRLKEISDKRIFFILIGLFLFPSCEKDDDIFQQEKINTPDWTIESHGENATPDFDLIFPDDRINRIDLVIEASNWQEMESDLEANLSGTQNRPGGDVKFDPVWVPCSVFFNGMEWYKVGVRFKGNSSLKSTYGAGLKKLPLKLDFDEFEDAYPDIKNQRFYGFRQLSLKNNFEDASFMREKVAARLFRNFGLASAHTAFYRLYVDTGEGAVYFGLYTLVEEVDDTVIETQFSAGEGNLYKPEGMGARFAEGIFSSSDMNIKTNEETSDFSDVRGLYEIINSSDRQSDYESWRSELTSVFNVEIFLKWLAANTVMQNWDAYGVMPHNYYLYNDPANGQLTWIPWDGNEALKEGKQGGALSLDFSGVGKNWPLIRYIIDDESWKEQYQENVLEFVTSIFNPDAMEPLYREYQGLLEKYVVGENGETSDYSFLKSTSNFYEEVDKLITHVSDRKEAVAEYLGIQY